MNRRTANCILGPIGFAFVIIVCVIGRMSFADVVVPITLPSAPSHHASLDDDEEAYTYSEDYWRIEVDELPNLRELNATGDVVLQVRTPNNKLLYVDPHPESAFEIQFSSIFRWSNGGSFTAHGLDIDAPIEFIGVVGNPPSDFVDAEVHMSAENTEPPDLRSFGAGHHSRGTPGGWGFTGYDIRVPVDMVLNHFGETPVLAPGESELIFTYKVPGNVLSSPEVEQFTRIVPEPAAGVMAIFAVLFLLPLRRRF